MSNYKKNTVFQGLGTVSTTVPDDGIYLVDGKISLSSIPAGESASSLVTVVNKNGSPVYTGLAGARGFSVKVPCAANDVIAVVFSSASNVDIAKNVIKSNISISVTP